MYKISLAKRNERLARKKAKRQLKDNPKSLKGKLMTRKGKRHVEDYVPHYGRPLKI